MDVDPGGSQNSQRANIVIAEWWDHLLEDRWLGKPCVDSWAANLGSL